MKTTVAILLLSVFVRASPARGEPMASPQLPAWTADLDFLATGHEKELFSSLPGEAERRLFLQKFWEARDGVPRTSRNEFREMWESRLAEADRRWHSLADERSRAYLLRGEPRAAFEVSCPKSGNFEIWTYEPGFRVDRRLVLVFLKGEGGEARLWRPGSSGGATDLAATVLETCSNQQRFVEEVRWIRMLGNDAYNALLAQSLSPPRAREWTSGFRPVALDTAESATPLAAEMGVEYVAPQEGKVVVRVTMLVATSTLPMTVVPADGLELAVSGEVLRGGEPFETFRFQLRGRPAGTAVPLAFERLLAPGDYLLRVRLEHVASRSATVMERQLSVPSLQLAEASPAQPPRLQLLPPPGKILTGRVRVSAEAEGIERVSFALDGKPLLTRNRPPFDVVLDLGPVPRLRKLRAEGMSSAGKVVARDDLLLNTVIQSFGVRLREPRPGQAYRQSLRIAADVRLPPEAQIDRVELWFGEERIATLYQPPYSLPFVLPRQGQAGYVRAVAFLAGGGSAEDVVFVNTPVAPDEMDVRMVELYTTVQDAQGQPVTGGLDADSFVVLEDGVRQQIREVKQAGDAPVRVVALIDSSGSMLEEMAETRQAALGFLRHLLRPKDQAALITFNDSPQITVPLTGNLGELEKGIQTILPESDTALYDSLAYSLLYLSAAQGQRAILLLTDGDDSISRLTYDQILETARRMAIAVYAIGLGVPGGLLDEPGRRLARLARVTGGNCYLIKDISELAGVYARIENELRSQYKIAYQSSNTGTDDAFRAVQVRLNREGLEARTLSGYYP